MQHGTESKHSLIIVRNSLFGGSNTNRSCRATQSVSQSVTGWEQLHRATDDERSERTRSVPSVASRRVAAPYGVDDSAVKTSI